HDAKFIVLFQPYSCRGLEGSLLDARREDIRTLLERNPNMIVSPEGMLELWPAEKFVSAEHLRVGYDEENFRRVGKFLARVLGGPAGGERVEGTGAEAVRRDAAPGISDWTPEGAAVLPEGAGGAQRLTESSGAGAHRADTRITGQSPGSTLVLSFLAKPIGARGVFVEVQTAGRRGGGYCDLYGQTAQRDGDMFDAGLDPQPDGWSRCWVAMPIDAPEAACRLGLMNERLDPGYVGDGRSGAIIRGVELRETAHFLAQEASPW